MAPMFPTGYECTMPTPGTVYKGVSSESAIHSFTSWSVSGSISWSRTAIQTTESDKEPPNFQDKGLEASTGTAQHNTSVLQIQESSVFWDLSPIQITKKILLIPKSPLWSVDSQMICKDGFERLHGCCYVRHELSGVYTTCPCSQVHQHSDFANAQLAPAPPDSCHGSSVQTHAEGTVHQHALQKDNRARVVPNSQSCLTPHSQLGLASSYDLKY